MKLSLLSVLFYLCTSFDVQQVACKSNDSTRKSVADLQGKVAKVELLLTSFRNVVMQNLQQVTSQVLRHNEELEKFKSTFNDTILQLERDLKSDFRLVQYGSMRQVRAKISELTGKYNELTGKYGELTRKYNELKAVTKGSCPMGYTNHGKSCYKIYADRLKYSDARAHCRDDGGNLVSIEAQEEQDFITELWLKSRVRSPSQYFHTSGLKNTKTGTWRWSTTEAIIQQGRSYVRWIAGYPRRKSGKDHLLLLIKRGGDAGWTDNGDNKLSFICESRAN